MTRLIQSRVRTSAAQVTRCVGSLLALELLHPGRELYLSAPVLRNGPILPNGLGQFSALIPEVDAAYLSLAIVLSLLAERGVAVRVIYPAEDALLGEFLFTLPPAVERRAARPLHSKGLFGESFSLRGAMHFTDFGVDVGDEQVELTTEPGVVSHALLEVRTYWEDLE